MDYAAAVDYLMSFADFERRGVRRVPEAFALDRITSLLRRLGEPQDGRLTVHIAGSKGKGSTAAMIESVLRATGRHTGFFSSPHRDDFSERIRLDGIPLATHRFAALAQRLQPVIETELAESPGRLSTFEILTAMAFCAFREAGVEAQVIEVGLGGRLDCTNVLRRKDAAVVTALSQEHTHILGSEIEKIAWEKAGIIHAGTGAAVLGPQRSPAAANTVREYAADIPVPLQDVSEEYDWEPAGVEAAGQWFRLHRRQPAPGEPAKTLFLLPLLGLHQIENAATAVATIDTLRRDGLEVPEAALHSGLALVEWPGRLETVAQDPRIVVDGAHNDESLGRVLESLPHYFDYERLVVVLGVLGDKEISGMAERLRADAAAIVITAPDHPRSRTAAETAAAFPAGDPTLSVQADVPRALAAARELASSRDLICVLGSLFVAAEARAHIQRQAGGRAASARADRQP